MSVGYVFVVRDEERRLLDAGFASIDAAGHLTFDRTVVVPGKSRRQLQVYGYDQETGQGMCCICDGAHLPTRCYR